MNFVYKFQTLQCMLKNNGAEQGYFITREHLHKQSTLLDLGIAVTQKSTKSMVEKVKKLNPHKTKGPDNICPRLKKETVSIISKHLTKILQCSLQASTVLNDKSGPMLSLI